MRSSAIKRSAAGVGVVAVLLTGTLGCSPSEPSDEAEFEPVTLRLTTVQAEASPAGAGLKWWGDQVAERTDGAVTVEYYWTSSLIPGPEMLPALNDGRVELAEIVSGFNPVEFPLWQISSVPFFAPDGGAAASALQELYTSNDVFRSEFENNGVKVLYYLPIGQGAIGTAVPIDSLEDLDGLRLRTLGYWANAVELVGGAPTFVETAEIYESIQRGVIDGFGGISLESSVGIGLHEVAPYYTDPGLGTYTSTALAISTDAFEALPEEIQQVLVDVGQEYLTSTDVQQIWGEAATVACDTLLDSGGHASLLPTAETEKWRTLADEADLSGQWATTAAEAGVAEADSAAIAAAYAASVDAYLSGDAAFPNGLADCAAR